MRRKAPRAPLAVAAVLATPLFFTALMATSLAVEKPSVAHVLSRGKLVAKLGDPVGSTERTIWLLAVAPPLVLVAIGVGAMFIGRIGVIASAVGAIAMTVALLVPLGTWTNRHIGRYPLGIDLRPRSSTSDIYLRGEWEGTARSTAEQLGGATIGIAALAVVTFVLLEVRRRRGAVPPPPPPPPGVVAGGNIAGQL